MDTGETGSKTTIHRGAVITVTVALLIVLAAVGESYYERSRAEALIQRLSPVEVGVTSQPLVEQETKSFLRFGERGSQYERFTFHNRGPALLHLAPHKWVWIIVEYKNGVLVEKTVQYFEEPRSGAVVTETSEPDALGRERQARHVSVVGHFPSPVGWVKVTNTPATPKSQREADWNISVRCMTAIGGCRDPRKVLRGVQIPNDHEVDEHMDEPTRSVFAAFIIVYLLLFALYELMVLKVNRQLQPNNAVSLIPLRQWDRLMREHTRLFPKSSLRGIAVGSLAVVLFLAFLLVALRVWLYLRP